MNGFHQLYLNSETLSLDHKTVPGSAILIKNYIIHSGQNNKEIVDIIFEYSVLDSKGNMILKIIETKAILLRADILKEIELPSDIEPGIYTLEVKARYSDLAVSISSYNFEVVEAENLITKKEQAITFLILFSFIFFSIYYQYKSFKHLENLLRN